VYYPETLAVFPYTRFAVPAFLGGKIYKAQTRKDAFIDSALSGKTILNLANDKGYEVDLGVMKNYMADRYAHSKHKNIYKLGSNTAAESRLEDVAILIDMALFRAAPHFIKPYIYNNQEWLLSPLIYYGEGMQFLYFKHTHFLNNLINNLSADRKNPVYKYIHVMNTHRPMVVNENCVYAGSTLMSTRETLTIQSVCTLNTVIKLFRKMKELGIYDDALIVMHADHGGWVPNRRPGQPIVFPDGQTGPSWIASLASPLLAIKKPYASDGLEVSPLLASLIDIPDTVSDIMEWGEDFGHESLLSMDPDKIRERRFYYYNWQENAWETDYTGVIQEFVIEGSHYESVWQASSYFLPPSP